LTDVMLIGVFPFSATHFWVRTNYDGALIIFGKLFWENQIFSYRHEFFIGFYFNITIKNDPRELLCRADQQSMDCRIFRPAK